mgnify:CR=1 FL=1
MRGYVSLPAFRVPAALDFSGLNDGIEAAGQRVEKNRLLDINRDIGSAIASGDYRSGAQKAFGYGNLETGMSLANTQRQIERERRQDARSALSDAQSRRINELKFREAEADLETKAKQRAAGLVRMIQNEQDPERRSMMWQRFTSADPRISQGLQKYGIDPADSDTGARFLLAEAGVETQRAKPIEVSGRLVQPQPDGTYKEVYAPSKSPQQTLSPAEKKEIFEADDTVMSGQNVIAALDRAIELNDQAYEGPAAGTLGQLTALFGGDAGKATLELDNIVTAQALESLKAIFGGMPTEGERKILLEIQGSTSMPRDVRKGVWERAKALAERRIAYNREKAQQLRTGEYFAPQPVAQPQIQETEFPPQAIDMLRGDPSPQRRQQFDEIFGAGASQRVLGR